MNFRSDNLATFVYLSEDRLYTVANETLYVYSMNKLKSPIATYQLASDCDTGMIINERLYLGGHRSLCVFKVTDSLTRPLKQLKYISTYRDPNKILRVGNELILG